MLQCLKIYSQVFNKALFILKIIMFLSWRFDQVGKRFDKKTKINFKMYDVTDWKTNTYNTNIVQYLKNSPEQKLYIR